MALRNAVMLGSTTHAYTGSGSDTTLGWDDSFTTYHYEEVTGDESAATTVEVSATHTFTTARTIKLIKLRLYAYSQVVSQHTEIASYNMYAQYYNGSWNNITGSVFSDSESGDNEGEGSITRTLEKDTGTVSWVCDLANVTAIKAYVYSYGRADKGTEGGESHTIKARIYELQAFYTVLKDYSGVV
jgi:hypothetical protein